jgi:hypothetical protein
MAFLSERTQERHASNMPRRNRVTPFSTLIATPARGTLTGNRGCLHDGHEQIRRQFQGKRWIICLLDFRGRKRPIMMPGRYTELFFLDESTALAAGHRPCAECQRERFNLFREAWAEANPEMAGTPRPAAATLDAILHQERITTSSQAHRFCSSIESLPDGAFVTDDEQTAFLVLRNQLLRWSPGGYELPPVRTIRYPVRVLTPASVVHTLAAGYPVGIHPSAFQGIEQSHQ